MDIKKETTGKMEQGEGNTDLNLEKESGEIRSETEVSESSCDAGNNSCNEADDAANNVVDEAANGANEAKTEDEIAELRKAIETITAERDRYFEALQRTAAEFDNYRKRTAREKEAIYIDALSDTFKAFLPVIDSVERAVLACSAETEADARSLREGIELIYRQIKDVMKNLGVEEIKGVGEQFDPELHNAVMHIEDEAYGQNVIVEEFQKGYRHKDRVIRHSMVKVAN